jgi:vitamin B12 transporter
LLTAALLLSAAPFAARAQQATQLPGITIVTPPTVQGATLERAPVKKAEPAPATSTTQPQQKKQAASQSAPVEASANTTTAAADSAPGIATDKVGSSVSVVTAVDIERQQLRHVSDALRSLPGVAVTQTGSTGSLVEVRLRGAEANHTLVIVDGIQANDTANGQFDFSNLAAEDIERIEVIRGPQSGLYGSGAVGGVINISTKKSRGPLALTVRSEFGSFNTRELGARLAGGNENGYIAMSGQIRTTDGFNISRVGPEPFSGFTRDDDSARLGSFALNAGGRIASKSTIDMTLRHVNKFARRDGDGFSGAFGPYAVAVDDPSFLRQSLLLAGMTLKVDSLEGRLTHEVKLNHNSTATKDFDRGAFGPYDFANDNKRTAVGYAATYRLGTPAIWGLHSVTGQIQHEDERFTPLGDFDDRIERARARTSYAGEWRGAFANQLFVTAGLRLDDNDQFQDFTTWRTTASWKIPNAGIRPHASIGTAVKMPSMFEQFGRSQFFFNPNPNLQPEESRGWDAGVEFTFLSGKALFDVTYFRANLTNKINGFAFPMPTNSPGESTREGIEFAGRYLLTPALSFGLAYTYTDAREADGSREVRRPPHSGKADVRYAFNGGRGTISVAATYNGERLDNAIDVNTFQPAKLPLNGYWLVSAAASYKIQPNVELFGRVENALNSKYQEVYGYDTAGVAVYAGVKITFDDIAGVGKAK